MARRYVLHVPPGVSTAPLPLLVLLHGTGGGGNGMDDLTGIVAVSDRERFLVALPDGIGSRWNDPVQQKESPDDVAFLRSVIDDVSARLPVDAARVYAAGMSNGGFLSLRLACSAADRIAAVALVSATALPGFDATCDPGHPVPIIMFLNTKDRLVPYNGGQFRFPIPFVERTRVVSAEDLTAFWVENNGCEPTPSERELPDRTGADNSRVVESSYGGCAAGSDVVLYSIEGGGHTWPGGKQYLPPLLIGTTHRDIDATEIIWRFFAGHARR